MAYNIGQLRFRNQRLRFSTDELLFKLDNLSTLWLLVLQFGNLVGNLARSQPCFAQEEQDLYLCFVVPAWLNRALCIPDLLQNTPVFLQ